MPHNCTTWNCFKSNDCSNCFPISNVTVTKSLSIGYLSHGLYAKHLQHFFNYFPRENFFFVRFEDLEEKGEFVVMNEICEWLGLETLGKEEWGDFSHTNSNEYPDMLEDEEKFLRQFFREPNKELYELLGRDFGWKS